MRWVRRGIVFAVVAALVAAIGWSFVPRPVAVDVATVQRGPFEATVEGEGMTRVMDRYTLSAPLTGNLARIVLEPGDEVGAGEVIARLTALEPPLADAQAKAQARARLAAARAAAGQAGAAIERARVARALAESALRRARELEARGALGAEPAETAAGELAARSREVESARFAAEVAAHEVELAEAALDRTARPPGAGEVIEVRAPVAGSVLRVHRESAGVVTAGAPLVEIADPRALEAVVHVATADAIEIRPGAAARIVRWGGPAPLPARVRRVEPSAFTKVSALGVEEQRVNVVLDLDAAPAALGDGYRVEAEIVVWRGADVVQLPSSALFRDGSAWAVFQLGESRARLTHVEVGRRSGLTAQVSAGLTAGDVVIVHPGDAIEDGVHVARR
jgi:HlyD family secretion protein